MTEVLTNRPEHQSALGQAELEALGALCLEIGQSVELTKVAEEHAAITPNPNTSGAGLFVAGEVPMTSAHAYRQVGLEAVQDLAQSGIVRNGATAQGKEHPRWGHKVFWNDGKDGAKISTGGRFVLEAPLDAVKNGWVTADKVTGIYTKTQDGEVRNILRLR